MSNRPSRRSSRLRVSFSQIKPAKSREFYRYAAHGLMIRAVGFEQSSPNVAADYLALAAMYEYRSRNPDGVTQCLERLRSICPDYDFDRLGPSGIKHDNDVEQAKKDFRRLAYEVDFSPVVREWNSILERSSARAGR